ncbi:MAG: amidase [Rhizobiaceae bacterium]
MSEDVLLGSATDMAAMVREKRISPSELLEMHFAQIDRVNPEINAVIWQNRDEAGKLARQLDEEAVQGRFRGPLHGVPITVKEAFDLVGSPSTWGNPLWKENLPGQDSEVVERYRNAGAIVFGKTNVPLNLYEWQSFNEIYGTTSNPWDLTRGPGGSSGGSAAALATGMTALEAGSDIGSSIRNPAHYCGVFGLKPTWGIMPMQGHLPPGWHCDIDIAVTGPMARHAVDLDLSFGILAGADRFARPAWSVDCPHDNRQRVSDFRVAVKLGDDASPVDAGYLDMLHEFARSLEKAGAQVSLGHAPAIDSEAHFDLYLTMLGTAMAFAYSDADVEAERASVEAMNDPVATRILNPRVTGKLMSHRDWQMTDNARRKARMVFDSFFQDFDILIAPVCASAAFPHDQVGKRHQRMITVNGKPQIEMLQLFWSGYSGVVGLPSAVGPAGFVNGLPVGYQAIAGHGRDRTALAFARAVEREIIGYSPPPIIAN